MTLKCAMLENSLKTIMVIVALWLLWPWIGAFVNSVPEQKQEALLTATGLVLAGAVAGTFAFSYEKTKMESAFDRRLGHFTTGALNLGIGLLFEIAIWSLAVFLPFNPISLHPISIVALIVYIAVISYDFWDLLRAVRK